MPAEIDTMAWSGKVPWHGLGVEVKSNLSAAQMLRAAKLNWTVGLYPLYYKRATHLSSKANFSKNLKCIDFEVPKKKALVRESDNSLLSVVGEEWQPTQNHVAFEFFKEFIDRGEMEMHTAGSLKGGQRVWALAKVKESFTILKQDKIQSYLLFSNPHLYGYSIDIRFTAIRTVCMNTLMLSLAGKHDLSVRVHHRHKFDAELVKSTLGIAHHKMDQYKKQAEFLARKRYREENVSEYIQKLFPFTGAPGPKMRTRTLGDVSHAANMAMEALETQPGWEWAPKSWWNAYNAVTFTVDHLLGRSADTRLERAWFGVNRERKVRALEMAVEYANAA